MNTLITLHNSVFARLSALSEPWLLPTLARLVFAAVLWIYFWNSAGTKLGDGWFGFLQPSAGAYAQVFPRAMDAAGFNTDNLGIYHWAVTVLGMWAEFWLPLLIVLGLLTRLAALGMIGFVLLQSLTDLYGHGGIADQSTLGAWFDRYPDSLILDQRLFWVTILLILLLKGAGPLSLDRLFGRGIRPV